jgi:hypothetical protein
MKRLVSAAHPHHHPFDSERAVHEGHRPARLVAVAENEEEVR